MNTRKMAVAGAGLIIAGMGLGAIGVALILPAVVAVATSAVKKAGSVVKRTGERLISEVERGSVIVGTAAGTLQRSLTDAVTEIRSASSSGSKEAV